jgi:hypothetical protein
MAEPAPPIAEGLTSRDRFRQAVRDACIYVSEDLGGEGTSGYLLSEDQFRAIFAAGDKYAAKPGGPAMPEAGPLSARCPYCHAAIGERCVSAMDWGRLPQPPARRPHKVRVKLATAVAAHADPALNAFPELGPVSPCGLCGSGLPQRHRIVDAIAGRIAAGEDPDEVGADYDLSPEALEAVQAWARKWPGAWSACARGIPVPSSIPRTCTRGSAASTAT